jgi:hypothetical protein
LAYRELLPQRELREKGAELGVSLKPDLQNANDLAGNEFRSTGLAWARRSGDQSKPARHSALVCFLSSHRGVVGSSRSKPIRAGCELAMLMADADRLAALRGRLSSLSWFMRCLCEWVARAANREDGSSGRFWAGRFKSQPLLDEAALLACSVYVDLNPIRAGIASTPEESQFTSGCDRIVSLAGTPGGLYSSREESPAENSDSDRPDAWLCELTLRETEVVPRTGQRESSPAAPPEMVPLREPIASDHEDGARRRAPAGSSAAVSAVHRSAASKRPLPARASDQGFLPIETKTYLMLLDWTGRELPPDKRGAIPDDLAPILDRLGVDRSNWVDTVRDFGRMFKQAAGRASSLVRAAPRCSRRWFQGKVAAQVAFLQVSGSLASAGRRGRRGT